MFSIAFSVVFISNVGALGTDVNVYISVMSEPWELMFYISMGVFNTILSAYTLYRYLG